MISNILKPCNERFITVTADIQPSIQEQLEATMDGTLWLYRALKLLMFFVMCVSHECPSPSFVLINQDTIWNTRSLKVYLLEHHSPVPEGQFDDTSIRVDPTPTQTMLKEKLSLSKNSSPKLDKKDIAVEEKTDGAETTLRSIMCRDDSFTQHGRNEHTQLV